MERFHIPDGNHFFTFYIEPSHDIWREEVVIFRVWHSTQSIDGDGKRFLWPTIWSNSYSSSRNGTISPEERHFIRWDHIFETSNLNSHGFRECAIAVANAIAYKPQLPFSFCFSQSIKPIVSIFSQFESQWARFLNLSYTENKLLIGFSNAAIAVTQQCNVWSKLQATTQWSLLLCRIWIQFGESAVLYCKRAVSYTHLTLPTTPYV